MTNHWSDLINSDVIMVMGANCAENHPMATRWLQRAKERGALVLSVDPRYTRTSAFADHYAKLRSGTDIAFVGGMINYALENNLINHDYVVEYTNASFIVDSSFNFSDGLFSGYDAAKRQYSKASWIYEFDGDKVPKRDRTLQHPRCVFQLLKKHFSRYTPELVCRITGTPREDFLRICEVFTSTWPPTRSGSWLYAMGTTQHSHGTENIRSYAILQLLLGNIGIAGGGVNAMRGESNVQGSTDMGLLFHLLPGYLKSPATADVDLATYNTNNTPTTNDPLSANWWGNTPKYVVSLLKSWWGEHATPENGFCYDYLPKRSANYSHMALFEAMYAGKLKGLFCFGQNPAVGGPNSNLERAALHKLEWLVGVDLFETETSIFWKRPGVNPADVDTEVFLLPAAASMEKEGSVSNSSRLMQWRYKAVEPVGDAKSDAWIVSHLIKEMKRTYAAGGVFPDPILQLTWEYGEDEEPDIHAVAKEINGRFVKDKDFPDRQRSFKAGEQVPGFAFLTDDGSTSCGSWIYCGSYTKPGKDGNMAARRSKEDAPNNIGLMPKWAWCWPVNRRILYNRASVDPNGNPYDPKRWVVRWNAEKKTWEGDVPDGPWAPQEKLPFIMRPEGVGCLFSSSVEDGPFPEHYEPAESPVRNLMSSVQFNPASKIWTTKDVDAMGTPDKFPIVATTYRVSEHWQAGAMTRNMPWLVELAPDVFVEIGSDLAKRKGINNGDRVVIASARGQMEAYALVTDRFEPFWVDGRTIDQVGIIWHYGYDGLAQGDSANLLTAHVGDANTMIPEYKAFLVDLNRKQVQS